MHADEPMEPIPSFIDFEASSLSHRSYPIEVAWNLSDGSIESHLISPQGIVGWDEWDEKAQQVHGIPRAELLAHGEPPSLVCQRMNQQLSGQVLYSDAPDFDGMWLARLFECDQDQPAFELRNANSMIMALICPDDAPRTASIHEIYVLEQEARRKTPGQHRAGWDVQYLVELWKLAHWRQKRRD